MNALAATQTKSILKGTDFERRQAFLGVGLEEHHCVHQCMKLPAGNRTGTHCTALRDTGYDATLLKGQARSGKN